MRLQKTSGAVPANQPTSAVVLLFIDSHQQREGSFPPLHRLSDANTLKKYAIKTNYCMAVNSTTAVFENELDTEMKMNATVMRILLLSLDVGGWPITRPLRAEAFCRSSAHNVYIMCQMWKYELDESQLSMHWYTPSYSHWITTVINFILPSLGKNRKTTKIKSGPINK